VKNRHHSLAAMPLSANIPIVVMLIPNQCLFLSKKPNLMTRPLLTLAFLCASAISFSQEVKVPTQALRQIKEKDLMKTMQVLVSDSLEGRATGTPGGEKAARYIASCFQQMGLEPINNQSFLQPFQLWKKERMPFTVTLANDTLRSFNDIFYISNVPQNSTIDREVIFVGDGNDSIVEKLDLKGKIALVDFKDLSRTLTVSSTLEKKGVWAVWGFNSSDSSQYERICNSYGNFYKSLPLSSTKPQQTEKGSRFFILSNNCVEKLTGYASKEVSQLSINQLVKKPIITPVSLTFPIEIKPVKTWNVIGRLRGTTDTTKNIAITAHYDHMGRQENDSILYGADDNASGVSTILELAQTYTSLKEKPKHNLLFIAFGGEELGLLGSGYFMSQADKNSFFANINIDMIARHDTATKDNYVYILGTEHSPKLQSICRDANAQGINLTIDDAYNHSSGFGSFMNRSDHFHFYKNNIPVVSFFSGLHNDYHTPRDTMDKLDFELWTKRIKLIFNTLYIIDNQTTLVQ